MVTICHNCAKKLENNPEEQFLLCHRCGRFTANYDYLKGGCKKEEDKMALTKEQKEYNARVNEKMRIEKEEKNLSSKEAKKTITQLRIEHANACIELLKERGVKEEEMTKIFSRAYNLSKVQK